MDCESGSALDGAHIIVSRTNHRVVHAGQLYGRRGNGPLPRRWGPLAPDLDARPCPLPCRRGAHERGKDRQHHDRQTEDDAPAGEAQHHSHDQHQRQRDEAEVEPAQGAADGNLLRRGRLVRFFLRMCDAGPTAGADCSGRRCERHHRTNPPADSAVPGAQPTMRLGKSTARNPR
jgi:hypothetical protein